MKIKKEIKADKSAIVTSAVVDYIKKNRIAYSKSKFVNIKDMIEFVYNNVGISVVSTKEEKDSINESIKKCITVLEEVGALNPMSNVPTSIVDYIEYKKNLKLESPIAGIEKSYYVNPDFSKLVGVLKNNEKIMHSSVADAQLKSGSVKVLIVKDVSFDQVKTCNLMFDYTKIANYIGCYNQKNRKVDFISTHTIDTVYFLKPSKHILPRTREILELYNLVNKSEYKKLFMQNYDNNQQSILSLRSDANKNISTENFSDDVNIYHSL